MGETIKGDRGVKVSKTVKGSKTDHSVLVRNTFHGDDRSGEYYTGKELEIDTFGIPKFKEKPEFHDRLASLMKGREFIERLGGLEFVREYYADDPENPEKEYANELRLALIELLCPKNPERIKFYSSLRTPVDSIGIDGFIDYLDPKTNKRITVTLDVTKNPDKKEWKADVILFDPYMDIEANEDRFMEDVLQGAQLIEEKIKSILEEISPRSRVGVYRDESFFNKKP